MISHPWLNYTTNVEKMYYHVYLGLRKPMKKSKPETIMWRSREKKYGTRNQTERTVRTKITTCQKERRTQTKSGTGRK